MVRVSEHWVCDICDRRYQGNPRHFMSPDGWSRVAYQNWDGAPEDLMYGEEANKIEWFVCEECGAEILELLKHYELSKKVSGKFVHPGG